MPTAAERYAAAMARGKDERTRLGAFSREYVFGLDDFQFRACRALEDGKGVLVAAPTGSGKTVVGEFAIHLALSSTPRPSRRCRTRSTTTSSSDTGPRASDF
jgi:ATP-dependent RNA helicase HelY